MAPPRPNRPHDASLSRACWWGLLLAVALGAALRLHGLAARSVWYDEGYSLFVADHYVDGALRFMQAAYNTDAPVIIVLLHAWQAVGRGLGAFTPGSEAHDFWVRLVPCLFGILGVPLTFAACRAIVKEPRAALVAAFLFAVSPLQVFYAQELKPYSIYVALSLAALVCFVKALEEDRWRYWVGLVAFSALLMYTHFFSVWNIAVMNLYFAVTLKTHWPRLWKWVLSQALVGLLSFAAVRLAHDLFAVVSQIHIAWFPRADAKEALITFKTFFAGYSPRAAVYWPLFLLAGALFAVGLGSLWRRWRVVVLLVCLTAVPIAGNVVMWGLREFSHYEHRLFIFSGAVSCMVVARGVVALRNRAAMALALAALAGLTAPCLADYYRQDLHPLESHRMGVRYKAQNREAAQYIAEHLEDGDRVGHTTHFTYYPFRHYFDAWQSMVAFTGQEEIDLIRSHPNAPLWRNHGVMPVRLETLLAGAERLWLVDSFWEVSFKPHPHTAVYRAWLDGQLVREGGRQFDGVTVYLYRNDPDVKARAVTSQVADSGEWTQPHYMFDEVDAPLATAWRAHMVEDASWRRPPRFPTFTLRFDRVDVGPEQRADVGGRAGDVQFLDRDGDGRCDAVSVDGAASPAGPGDTIRLVDVDYNVLAVDPSGPRAMLAGFPTTADDAFAYRFTVENHSDVAQQLRCVIHESAEVLDPLTFSRAYPGEPVWRPVLQYDPWPPPGTFNTFAMEALLTGAAADDALLWRDVTLSPGPYAVYASMVAPGGAAGQVLGAETRFTLVSRDGSAPAAVDRPLGAGPGVNVPYSDAWTWCRLEDVTSDGTPSRLTVAAHAPDHGSEARCHLGRVLFVPLPDAGPDAPAPAREYTVPLGPREAVAQVVTGALGDRPAKRVDIEVFDPATPAFRRHIWFYVRRQAAPPPAGRSGL